MSAMCAFDRESIIESESESEAEACSSSPTAVEKQIKQDSRQSLTLRNDVALLFRPIINTFWICLRVAFELNLLTFVSAYELICCNYKCGCCHYAPSE